MPEQNLPAHLQRMLDEYDDLAPRLDRLTGFVDTAPFRALDPVDQSLLRMQQKAMADYEKVLRARIERGLAALPAVAAAPETDTKVLSEQADKDLT